MATTEVWKVGEWLFDQLQQMRLHVGETDKPGLFFLPQSLQGKGGLWQPSKTVRESCRRYLHIWLTLTGSQPRRQRPYPGV
jgi:hypothetical protein